MRRDKDTLLTSEFRCKYKADMTITIDGGSLRSLRANHGMTQSEMADRIGVSQITVSNWERGVASPRPEHALLVSKLLQNGRPQFARPIRPIQYLGSKVKIAPKILEVLDRRLDQGETVCDLFSGSGVVSHALSFNYRVISVDIQHYAAVLARTLTGVGIEKAVEYSLISKMNPPVYLSHISKIEEELLDSVSTDQGRKAFADFQSGCSFVRLALDQTAQHTRAISKSYAQSIRKNYLNLLSEWPITTLYGGVYFSFRQSLELDVLCRATHKLHGRRKDLSLAAILATASNLADTVGKQFAQPASLIDKDGCVKSAMIQRSSEDRKKSVWENYIRTFEILSNGTHKVLCRNNAAIAGDYADFLESSKQPINAIYADPPYTIDHYSRFYHVLETIARGDIPDVSRTSKFSGSRILKGIYRNDRHQSPFCIGNQVLDAFSKLFRLASVRTNLLILSYSSVLPGDRPRLLSLETIMALGSKWFRNADITHSISHNHRRLHSSLVGSFSSENSEVLIAFTGAKGNG